MTSDLRSHILIKLSSNENTIGIRTYSREIGRHGRFLICRDELATWLRGDRKRDFLDMDCGHVLRIHSKGQTLRLAIYWLSQSYSHLHGYEQQFELPEAAVYEALCRESGTSTHLYVPRSGQAKIELHVSHEAMGRILSDSHRKRAFSKAMRESFIWPDDVVRLYYDGNADFFFRTQSGWPSCGGLILHDSRIRTDVGERTKLVYSVHT